MNFDTPLLKTVRVLLFPFSLIYGLIIRCRNWCYDLNLLPSKQFNIPVICVGNLSVGGTGKTPMVEFLVRAFSPSHQLAIVSRGYKRGTSGFLIADSGITAADIGDEPMQFFEKFSEITIAVGEKRAHAIEQVIARRQETEIIVLDDAFQHRAVKAGLNILLTDYTKLYTRDILLPAGNLRDEKRSARRADILVVTKCPETLADAKRLAIVNELAPRKNQFIFFTSIRYGDYYQLGEAARNACDSCAGVLLVTGIADPTRLRDHLTSLHSGYHEMVYPDHHAFTKSDIEDIRSRFAGIVGPKIIVTTEKDATRLRAYSQQLSDLPVYVIPIECNFLFGDAGRFTDIIATFIERFDHKTTPPNE